MIFDKSITRRTMGYILSAFTHTFLPFLSICTQSLSLNLALHILVSGLIPHNSLDIISGVSTDIGDGFMVGATIGIGSGDDIDGGTIEGVETGAGIDDGISGFLDDEDFNVEHILRPLVR